VWFPRRNGAGYPTFKINYIQMKRSYRKSDFPVDKIRKFLEPGPIVLVSSGWQDHTNIMTMGWHTVLEFSPSLIGCLISNGNFSYEIIKNSGECVINAVKVKAPMIKECYANYDFRSTIDSRL
jgi:flavin reductase (DIM6/NTAB) family NADH-FMN oxidoreductase RutF